MSKINLLGDFLVVVKNYLAIYKIKSENLLNKRSERALVLCIFKNIERNKDDLHLTRKQGITIDL